MTIVVLLASGDQDTFADTETEKFDYTILEGGVLAILIEKSLSEILSATETEHYRHYSPNAWVTAYKT